MAADRRFIEKRGGGAMPGLCQNRELRSGLEEHRSTHGQATAAAQAASQGAACFRRAGRSSRGAISPPGSGAPASDFNASNSDQRLP